MKSSEIINDLTERFKRNISAYKSGRYNEAQVRREFIDPMFKNLGWDMDNERGYAEAYKDVIHEDAIKIGGATKAPDYCFRIGGTRKFFIEAKKPSIDLKHDISASFQLRRYAWSAKLPLSILTDFEEFAVYDCRIKPHKNDKASNARTFYIYYTEYAERWDEIASIFSREAILRGSFDKYVESKKLKRGTAEVDTAFLEEIESWRETLARNIALRNSQLTRRELNFAVQRTIDRVIFLRICEDRGIEDYGKIMALLNGNETYKRLCHLFHRADERYNSGLFHFERERGRNDPPDELTTNLTIDDKVLKNMIKNLYYPESPYEFSVLPADILGQVYEQFLGKVIKLTPGHRAVVEEKPEVKKAGGVYYTPTYIVDYIVKHTVGKLVEGKKPGARGGVSKLKILDPACGSGSFLIGAYQYLLDWHRDKYIEDGPEKHRKELFQVGRTEDGGQRSEVGGRNAEDGSGNLQVSLLKRTEDGKNKNRDEDVPPTDSNLQSPNSNLHYSWQLTTSERKRILLNNIYGVDIDPQAVEVTKLSLLLKVLEGESKESMATQLTFFHERALPDLSDNIKCGNSLISPDFYDNQQMSFLDEEEQYRINVFDWESEFPEIFKGNNPGFDAVIGNPPYVRQETLGSKFKEYAKKHFETYAGTADLYVYFIEKSHCLLRKDGFFGMICSNKFIRSRYGMALRNFLHNSTTLRQIVDFGELPVFLNASTFPAIFLTQKKLIQNQNFIYAPIKTLSFNSLPDEVEKIGIELDNRSLKGDNWTLARKEEVAIFEKIKQMGTPMGEYLNRKIFRGILTGYNKAFIIDRKTRDKLISRDPKCEEIIKPFVKGDDVRKYHINFRDRYLILIPKGWTRLHSGGVRNAWKWFKENYPALSNYLEPFAEKAKKRWDKGEYWWELRACDYYEEFEKPKIIYPDIAKESRIAFDNSGLFLANTIYFLPVNDLYLLGLLNSKLIFTYYKYIAAVLGDSNKGGRLRWFTQDVLRLPIRPINFSDPSDKSLHDRMVELVDLMLSLHKRLSSSRIPGDKIRLQRRIDATDRQIDKLVYELYELTEEEIEIVEESMK